MCPNSFGPSFLGTALKNYLNPYCIWTKVLQSVWIFVIQLQTKADFFFHSWNKVTYLPPSPLWKNVKNFAKINQFYLNQIILPIIPPQANTIPSMMIWIFIFYLNTFCQTLYRVNKNTGRGPQTSIFFLFL